MRLLRFRLGFGLWGWRWRSWRWRAARSGPWGFERIELICFPRPGLAPAGDLLFFASPKKRRKKKGDPTVCDPCASLRGNLRCSRFAGSRRTRFAQTAASPDPRNPALLGAYRGAWRPNGPLLRSATRPPQARSACGGWDWLLGLGLGPSEAKAARSHPFCMRRGAQMEAGSGPQLFERNAVERVLRTPAGVEHRRLPVAQRRDADSRGRLSLLTFFGEAKKVSRPPGRDPASGNKQANC